MMPDVELQLASVPGSHHHTQRAAADSVAYGECSQGGEPELVSDQVPSCDQVTHSDSSVTQKYSDPSRSSGSSWLLEISWKLLWS